MDISQILNITDDNEKITALHQFCNQHYQNWTETEKLINAVLDMESEVMNGGFQQYFQNYAGDQWEDAFRGLENIGANNTRILFEKALSIFPYSAPSDSLEERKKALENLTEEQLSFLDDIDQQFYLYEDNLQSLVISYAEIHRNDFDKQL